MGVDAASGTDWAIAGVAVPSASPAHSSAEKDLDSFIVLPLFIQTTENVESQRAFAKRYSPYCAARYKPWCAACDCFKSGRYMTRLCSDLPDRPTRGHEQALVPQQAQVLAVRPAVQLAQVPAVPLAQRVQELQSDRLRLAEASLSA